MHKWSEARYGDYILRVVHDGKNYHILLLETTPKVGTTKTSEEVVHLSAGFISDELFVIGDIQGNGYFSCGLKGKGIGTLLVNVMLSILKKAGCGETEVKGDLTHAGDPDEPTLAQKCKEDRERFWQSFGFSIVPIPRCDQIRAKVKDLRVVSKPAVFGVVPNCPDLSDLQPINRDDYGGDWFRFAK